MKESFRYLCSAAEQLSKPWLKPLEKALTPLFFSFPLSLLSVCEGSMKCTGDENVRGRPFEAEENGVFAVKDKNLKFSLTATEAMVGEANFLKNPIKLSFDLNKK